MAAIVFISKKQFKKEQEKLAKWADYQLLDATGGTDVLSHKYNHCETTDGFCPDKKVYKPVERDVLDSDYDMPDDFSGDISAILKSGSNSEKFTESQKKAQKRFLKSKNFMMAFGLCLDILVRTKGMANVYIIVKNGVYKNFAEKMLNRMEKIMGDHVGKICYLWDDLDEGSTKKAVLTQQVPQADLDIIKEMAIAINKEYVDK